MSLTEVHIGQVLRLKHLRDFPDQQKQAGRTVVVEQVSYNAPKGKVFLVLLLGVENADGSNAMSLDDLLKNLGLREEP